MALHTTSKLANAVQVAIVVQKWVWHGLEGSNDN